jgi:dipeptidyl aminopeptidase/acylaminoacyl peptidase
VTDQHLQRLLERAGDEGRAQAQVAAWPVVREAFAQEHAAARRPQLRRPVLALAGFAALAAIVALSVTKPGAAVADWVRDHIIGTPGVEKAAPALTRLPGGGRMLVNAPGGVWVVNADGSRRLLSGYRGATWSPHGLYVGAWRGHQLFAVEPGGRVHWSLARSGRIHAADWSPDGFRIAYLSGHSLRVVAGDGTGDVQLRARVAHVAPAWKPTGPHLLALAAHSHVVDLVATDARALAWRHRVPQAARALAWSADGRLLAVAGRTTVTILDGATGAVRMPIRMPSGFSLGALAFAHRSPRLAVAVRARSGEARAMAMTLGARAGRVRLLFAGAGRFSQLQWSPDDRWVLLAWPAANQWLFLRSTRVSAVSAVRDIARQFDPGSRGARFPAIADWCCG